jgi:1,3-beta-glucan synthase
MPTAGSVIVACLELVLPVTRRRGTPQTISECPRRLIPDYPRFNRLGHPSEKLSTDVPRASWKVVIVSEILAPLALAVLLSVCYLFVKAFPNGNSQGPFNGLARLAIVAIGPIAWNTALLIVLFFVSLFAGPMLGQCCNKFGSVMAAIAHLGAVVGVLGIFEFLVRCGGF